MREYITKLLPSSFVQIALFLITVDRLIHFYYLSLQIEILLIRRGSNHITNL